MPTQLAPVDLANLALAKIGNQSINSLLDSTNQSSRICNTTFQAAYLAVSRAARWNCLLTTAILTPIVQTPLPGCPPPVDPATWAPFTTYAANTYLTYGGYYYQVEFTYTSTNNFTNDLTTGALVQTNLPTTQPFFPPNGSQFPSGWQYGYALPAEFQLLASLNENTYWGNYGFGAPTSDYQIMQGNLFCNTPQAVIQYVQNVADTTKFDALFVDCLSFKWASMISTPLRQDSGAMEKEMLEAYRVTLREARTKNGGEQQARRFNPIPTSRFNQARYGGING